MTRVLFSLIGLLISFSSIAQQVAFIPKVGVVQAMEQDSLLAALGYACLTEKTPKILSPFKVSEDEFQARLPAIKSLKVPIYACNLFIPGKLKVVGPEVDEAAVLAYVEVVLRRAQAAGLTLITWGSCGSRRVPPGYSKIAATAQFIRMAKRVAEVAEKYNITLALENLNSTECNFINSLREALEVVKAVDHKNFRLCVDIYHMLKDNEPATAIVGTGPYAVYSELAEKESRTPPGVNGDDFRPYLRALKNEGYAGKIVIECRWGDFETQGTQALFALQKQIMEVYGRD